MSNQALYDMIKMSASAPGTGTITLGAAVTAHSALPAGADGALLAYTIRAVDGSGVPSGAWETVANGLYTHSGTTLTRGTLRASSTGAAVNFSGAVHVSFGPLASMFRPLLFGTDAAVTLAPNSDLELDASILTADRLLTLPTAAQGSIIGDVIEVATWGGSSAYEAILKTGAGETCEWRGAQIAAASEISRLFITGEFVRFKKVSASQWRADGRLVPQAALMRLSTSASGETAATNTVPTSASGVWTADKNIGSIADTANSRIKVRRAGMFHLLAVGTPTSNPAADKYFQVHMDLNGTSTIINTITQITPVTGTTSATAKAFANNVPLAVDDYVQYLYASEEGSKGLNAQASPWLRSFFSATEVL